MSRKNENEASSMGSFPVLMSGCGVSTAYVNKIHNNTSIGSGEIIMAVRSDIRKLLALIADGTKADVPSALKSNWRKFRKNKTLSGWLDDPGIQGFGLAPKIKDGQVPG